MPVIHYTGGTMAANGTIVIFDMDGTLTRPYLRFDAIRREIGVAEGSILEAIAGMPAARRDRAEAVLRRHEAEAAANSRLQPGAADVVAALHRAGVPVALMTRNSLRSAETVQRLHGLAFDLTWTREDGPTKPAPEPVLAICQALGARADAAWVVGDFCDDLRSGRAAGAQTVLFLEAGRERPSWADEADHVIHTWPELPALLGVPAKAAP